LCLYSAKNTLKNNNFGPPRHAGPEAHLLCRVCEVSSYCTPVATGSKRCSQMIRCLLACRAKWSERANVRAQCRQRNGLAPVCFRMWRVSSSERAKCHWQLAKWHRYGFSPTTSLWYASAYYHWQ